MGNFLLQSESWWQRGGGKNSLMGITSWGRRKSKPCLPPRLLGLLPSSRPHNSSSQAGTEEPIPPRAPDKSWQSIWCQAVGRVMPKPCWQGFWGGSQTGQIWDRILALGAAPAPARSFLLQNLFCARTSAPRGVITWEIAAVSEQDFQYPPHWRCPYCL